MNAPEPARVDAPNSAPIVEPGVWIMASARLGRRVTMTELYPCLCEPPCRSKGERTCPCAGRTANLDRMPEWCCARNAARASTWHRPAGRAYSAPAQGLDDEPAAPLPGRAYAAPAVAPPRRRYSAPRSGELPVYSIPVRILEAWERQSRRPGPGEADCLVCGELIAEQLVKQGIYVHVGC